MHEITKKKYIFTILLPVTLLLGVVILVATSIGPILNAALEVPFIQLKNEKDKLIEKIETKNELETFQLIATEDGLFELKYDERYSVLPLSENKEELSIPIYHKENLPTENIEDIFNKITKESEAFYDGEKNENEEKVKCIQVMETESKGSFYFDIKKDQIQWLRIERKTTEPIEVKILTTGRDTSREQQLIHFKSSEEVLDTSSSTRNLEEKQKASQEQEGRNKKEAVESKTSLEEKKVEEKEIISDTTLSESDTDSVENTETEEKNDDMEKEYSEKKLAVLGTPESYQRILAVETKEAKDSLDDLLKSKYGPEDSLKKPQYLVNATNSKLTTKEAKSESPIIVRDVNINVKTGSGSFDTDNNPGHDKDENNNIVRSFDKVSYLLSFSIQNNSMDEKYTNIRYRVIADLDNAVEVVNGVPRNNAEIANGSYIDKTNDSGAQYSEGIMESVLNNTGQVFVPILMNVYGSTDGKKLKPTIKLEIVDALNVETNKVETFNKSYDASHISKLEIPETIVSAKPSVGVKLVAGETEDAGLFGWASPYCKGYDVGVMTFLKPLSGRQSDDFRGSTFPKSEIKYNIKQKGTYQKGANAAQNLTTAQYTPFTLASYAPAINDRNNADWTTINSINTDKLTEPLDIPNAKTKKIYTSQPQGDLSKIGVFDAGTYSASTNTSTYLTSVSNSNYQQTINPYTYSMTGTRLQSPIANSFSSAELVFYWVNEKTENEAKANGWTNYTMSLYVDSVSYDGITTTNDSSIDYHTVISSGGTYSGGPTVARGNSTEIIPMNDGNTLAKNSGNVQVNRGDSIGFTGFPVTTNKSVRTFKQIFMWDPTAFEYDFSSEPFTTPASEIVKINKEKFAYGVSKSLSTSAPYTMKINDIGSEWAKYNWYDKPEDAKVFGEISAVFATIDISESSFDKGGNAQVVPYIPVKVIGNSGSRSPAGNPLVVLSATQFLDGTPKILHQQPTAGTTQTYKPTVFDSSGLVTSRPNGYWNWFGESIFIKNFSVTTKTDVERSLYKTDEEIRIKVNGIYTGSPTESYDSTLTTTLPKGIHYKVGTAKDAEGKSLSNPVVTTNLDGTTNLRWTFSKVELSTGSEVNFEATSDFTQLSFNDTGYTENLKVQTIAEMWVTGNPTIKDESKEVLRQSSDTFIERVNQQIILSKDADKPFIETGDSDPLGTDTSITYNIKMVNESIEDVSNAKLLEVLPYNGDSRGTVFGGSYTVEEIKVNDPTAKINFTTNTVNEKIDPNTISGWTTYTPGVTAGSSIKNAKAILVSHASLGVGKTIELTVKIQPKNQKAGDVLVNNATMNSDLNLPVNSQTAWTRVYGRDLTGYVWYDDNYDGLIGNKANGTPEDPAGNIPVKLYRTSQVKGTYVKELVRESLTGQKFIDSSGNSLIETATNGKYTFNNLPEGKYLAEFVVGDLVVKKDLIVTKQNIGSDVTKNSKASPTNYKTPEYKSPILKDLQTLLTGTDKVHHVKNVNAGLTRLSKLRLFKYEEGSAVDNNADGKLSEAEIESSGRPLKDAEFDIYKGNSTNAADKIGSAKTDSSGWLDFPGLIPGDYTIVETKAPKGFELLKEPIKVTITTYNSITKIHVSDNGQTELPFTGGTGPMFIALMLVSGLGILGLGGLYWYYRQPSRKGEG